MNLRHTPETPDLDITMNLTDPLKRHSPSAGIPAPMARRLGPALLATALLAALPFIQAEDAQPKEAAAKKEAQPEAAAPKKEAAAKKEAQPEAVGESVAHAIGADYPAEETALYSFIAKAFEEAQSKAELAFLKGRTLCDASVRSVAVKALEQNLSIQLAAHDQEVAWGLLREARAVFLPVFSVSLNFDNPHDFRRKRNSLIERRILDPALNPSPTPIPPLRPPSKIEQIILLGFDKETIPGPEFAHKPSQKKLDNTGTYKVSVTQQLPWGGSFRVTNTTVYRRRYQSRAHPRDYGVPWTTNFLTEYLFPLPWTKNFGAHAPLDTEIKLAKATHERSQWDLRTVVNSTLQTVDLLHWDLVSAALALDATRQNRLTVEKLAQQTEDLFKNQRATEFDRTQVQAELLRVQDLEVQAWNSFLLVSDALVELLNLDPVTVLVPRGYAPLLQKRLAYDPSQSQKLARDNRPELKAEKITKRFFEILVRNRKVQLRPDLQLSGSVKLSQSNSVAGFPSFGQAYGHLFNEDSQSNDHTLTYTRQLFNSAEKGQLVQAQANLEAQEITIRLTENQVDAEVNFALADLEASAGRLAASVEAVNAAKKATQQAQELRGAGRLTEFEMISRSQDYLNADLSYIGAQVAYKQAETRLLAAMGTLPGEYPEYTAPNTFDEYRLKLLQAAKVREYFGRTGLPGEAFDIEEKTEAEREKELLQVKEQSAGYSFADDPEDPAEEAADAGRKPGTSGTEQPQAASTAAQGSAGAAEKPLAAAAPGQQQSPASAPLAETKKESAP